MPSKALDRTASLETTDLVLLAREAVADDAFKRSRRLIWLHCFGLQLLILAVLFAIAKVL